MVSQTRALAFRIQDDITAHFSGDRALIVCMVYIHHPAIENANIAALSRVTGGKLEIVVLLCKMEWKRRTRASARRDT